VKRALADLPARGRVRVPGRIEVLAPATLDEDDVALAWAEKLLERWGVVSREVVFAERAAPRWRVLRDVYRRLEAQGRVRRGRFVEGFWDEQYATEDVVQRLRKLRRRREEEDPAPIVVPAAEPLAQVLLGNDPAKPRVRRLSGDRVVFFRGIAVAAIEGGETRALRPVDDDVLAAVR
jgi:ATP-dependent Lhr-like helicase